MAEKRVAASGKAIRIMCIESGTTLTELARRLGISKQALHQRLSGNMSFNSFVECVDKLGFDLYYGRNGTVKKISER